MLDDNSGGFVGNGSGHGSNSNSISYKGDGCSSFVSDVGFYDAMDEVLEFLRLTKVSVAILKVTSTKCLSRSLLFMSSLRKIGTS